MTHETIVSAYLHSGLSIIPIKRDGSKRPMLDSWLEYQERQATPDELAAWIRTGCEGWGLVCGKVSGNVEVIDFDDPDLFTPWREQIPVTLYAALTVAQTPSGGWHVIYRCQEIEKNQKIARRLNETTGEIETLIETRGEGGQILVEPTTGAYHETGRAYKIVQGTLLDIAEIAPVERALLFNAARVLDEYCPVARVYVPADGDGNGNGDGDGKRPGDEFAAHTTWNEILEPRGWTVLYSRSGRTVWQRPGKDGLGGSAVTGGKSKRHGFEGLYVYSTNAAPFENDRGYGKFHAYALLEHGGDFSEAAHELQRQGFGRQVIVRPRATPPLDNMPAPEIPDTLEELTGAQVPPLPDAACIDPAIGADACRWLDEYVALSRLWSPRAYDDFHIACALWLLSTVAARRVVVHLGGPRYPNLYIALVARSSLWAKSTTAKIVGQTLRDAGLSFFLAPDDSTPQRFISDLVLKVPADWDQLDMQGRQAASARMAFPAARGWFYEELGMKLDAMLQTGGFMADFRGILRAFDDCPETYQYASIGRGLDSVQNPYIAMLGNMTPSDLQRATKKSPGLWQDGFWARWAFVTPPGDSNSSRARFPSGEREIPDSIVEPIKRWHERLGVPEVDVEPRRDDDGKTTGWDAVADPTRRTHVTVDQDVFEAYYAYHDALLDVVEQEDNKDFDGNYARFAEKALRVAMLLASLEHGDRITLPVWARAQGIAERWRRSLHELYAQANEPAPNEQMHKEEMAMQIIMRHGEMTSAQVARFAHVSSMEMSATLEALVAGGALVRTAESRRGTVRYALAA